jgi:hypothetical protein
MQTVKGLLNGMQTGEGGRRKKVDKNTGEAEWRRREKGNKSRRMRTVEGGRKEKKEGRRRKQRGGRR